MLELAQQGHGQGTQAGADLYHVVVNGRADAVDNPLNDAAIG